MSDVRLWTFGNYKIREILDVDLVSTTYRATAVDGDELRRLRVFSGRLGDARAPELPAAVIAEARRATRVRHPNILATHDAGRYDDQVYVVSDDVPGASLREFIARNHLLRPRTALGMGWQLAEALDALHAAGIAHGSVNPHTTWVADGAGRDVPMAYLTGFGTSLMLAQQVRNQHKAPVSDDLLYVGPDQMRNERASPEADRYALACALYHLMTGAPPFQRRSVNALFGAHLFSPVEPATSARPDLPPALDSVFARALAKDTGDRYPSAHALMIGVERALRGQKEHRAPAQRPPDGDVSDSDDAGTRLLVPDAGPAGDVPAGDGAVQQEPAVDEPAAETPVPGGPGALTTPDAGSVASDGDSAAPESPEALDAEDPAPGAAVHRAEVQPSTRRSDRYPAEFFEWDGAGDAAGGGGSVESRRAARERRGVQAGRTAISSPAPPPRPTVTVTRPAARPPAGRGRRLLRGAAVVLVAAALAGAAVSVVSRVAGGGTSAAADGPQRPAAPAAEPAAAARPQWTASLGSAAVRAMEVTDDAVVISAGRNIAALEPTSGEQLWADRVSAKVTGVALLRDVLIAGTREGVTAYHVPSGEVRWTLAGESFDAFAVGRREVYAAQRDPVGITLSAIDPADGDVSRLATIADDEAQADDRSRVALAFDRGADGDAGQTLYLLTGSALHAFDPTAGTERWRAPVDPEGVPGQPHMRHEPWVASLGANGGAAFVVDRSNRVCRYAAESGALVWTECERFPARLRRAPALHVRGGRVVVANADTITAYDVTAGASLWTRTLDEPVQRPLAGGAGTIYVADQDGALQALDHGSGRQRWMAEDAGDVTALAADDDGVYSGGADGDIARWHDAP